MTPDIFTALLNDLLGCACQCLNSFGSCPCPCRIFISAGPPVWDLEACCSDGQLTINVDRLFVYDSFPSEQQRVNTCQANIAADVSVVLLRCFPSLNDDGSAPNANQIGAASEAIYQDLYVLTNCIICNLVKRGKKQESVFRGSRIVGPQGGCVGAEIKFTIAVPDPLPII